MPKKILIVAGEPSGDNHAANLVRELKNLRPDLQFFGLGGELSKKAGVEVIFDISKLALVGAIEVLKNIFTVKEAYKKIIEKIGSERPDLAILVDYPGFNLRLARALKRRSIPVVYYISPQVWAWGMDRVKIIKACVKKMIVFFKFEEEIYRKHGVSCEFVGHPLLDTAGAAQRKEDVLKKYNLSGANKVVTLMPGSRESEVRALLPVMISAARIIAEKLRGAKFVVIKHPGLAINLYEKALATPFFDVRLVNGEVYNVLSASDLAIVASGTATLECAIIGTPLVITYRAHFITYLLYKIVSRIRFLGLVNILAAKELAPELLQYNATAKKIAAKSLEILTDEKLRLSIREDLKKVRLSLGEPGASMRAAKAILPLIG